MVRIVKLECFKTEVRFDQFFFSLLILQLAFGLNIIKNKLFFRKGGGETTFVKK